jgi:hypothetical protein
MWRVDRGILKGIVENETISKCLLNEYGLTNGRSFVDLSARSPIAYAGSQG